MAWRRNHTLFFSSYTSTIFIFLILFFIDVELIYNVVPISAVQKSD